MKNLIRIIGMVFFTILLVLLALLAVAAIIIGVGLIIGKASHFDAFILGAFTNLFVLLFLPVIVHLALVALDLFLLLQGRSSKGWMKILQICMLFFGIVSMVEACSFFFIFEVLDDLDNVVVGNLVLHSFWVFTVIHAIVEVVLWIARICSKKRNIM